MSVWYFNNLCAQVILGLKFLEHSVNQRYTLVCVLIAHLEMWCCDISPQTEYKWSTVHYHLTWRNQQHPLWGFLSLRRSDSIQKINTCSLNKRQKTWQMLVKKITILLPTTKIQFTSILHVLVESGKRVRENLNLPIQTSMHVVHNNNILHRDFHLQIHPMIRLSYMESTSIGLSLVPGGPLIGIMLKGS